MNPQEDEGHATNPFPFRSTDITHLDISGGTWHHIEGNSTTFNHCQVVLTQDFRILRCSPLSSTRPHSAAKRIVSPPQGCGSRAPTKTQARLRSLASNCPPTLHPSVSPTPAQFLAAETTLKNIASLIAPHTGAIGIFKRIEPYLQDLKALVGFASTAHAACGSGTRLGNVIRASIDTRMEQCNDTLSELLIWIARSPYRLFPRTRYACCVVYEWFTCNEPDDIRNIRLNISEEATAISKWLRCLHS
jgi:hypothetical protein